MRSPVFKVIQCDYNTTNKWIPIRTFIRHKDRQYKI